MNDVFHINLTTRGKGESMSRFERPASDADRQGTGNLDHLLSVLLAVAPEHERGAPHRSVWRQEELHRAHCLQRLASRLPAQAIMRSEIQCAERLQQLYRSLPGQDRLGYADCSGLLNELARALVALFGQHRVTLHTAVTQIFLSGSRRRALVLATSELVCNALLHSGARTIRVAFRRSVAHGRLMVTDNGVGCPLPSAEAASGALGALADLIGGVVLRHKQQPSGTAAEILFPVDGGRRRAFV